LLATAVARFLKPVACNQLMFSASRPCGSVSRVRRHVLCNATIPLFLVSRPIAADSINLPPPNATFAPPPVPPHPALQHLPTARLATRIPGICLLRLHCQRRTQTNARNSLGFWPKKKHFAPFSSHFEPTFKLRCNHLARPSVSPSDAVSKIYAPLGFHGEQFVSDVSGLLIGPLEPKRR